MVIQRQRGHAGLGVTSAYLRGIDNTEIIHTVHERPTPMQPGSSLRPDRRSGCDGRRPEGRRPSQPLSPLGSSRRRIPMSAK